MDGTYRTRGEYRAHLPYRFSLGPAARRPVIEVDRTYSGDVIVENATHSDVEVLT